MDKFPTDLLVYGAIFLMILLFNYLARQRARQQVPPAQDEALAPDAQYEPEPPSEFWGRVDSTQAAVPMAPEPVARAEQPRSRAPVSRRAQRYDRRSLFGSKREVRKAIVLMTVLGAPRGAEPPAGGTEPPAGGAVR